MSSRQKIDPHEGVRRLRLLYAAGKRAEDIATEFGIHVQYVREIARGARYPNSPGPIVRKRDPVFRPSSEDKEAAEIRYRHANGEAEVDLAAAYGYQQSTISDIVRHRSRCPHAPRKVRS